jgi:N-methylhydantoinase B/oxoprolinase/acetone carboxylase alpha subunit
VSATRIDPITLDLIENALLNARFEMDEVVRRAAMSPTIRVQHDEFPMICNQRGQMVVGQFGSYIPEVIDRFGGDIGPGDVILLNDPYLCRGSISHCNDWLVIVPIFHEKLHVGFASMFGHMMDVGGKVPGSQVNEATSIWEEGLRIPPIKVFERGVLNETALAVILNNTRTPETNRSDLMALIGGCRAAERRVVEICDRFGTETFALACDALLERTRAAVAELIRRYIPQEPVSFTDWVDDDGLGNGPFKMVLTLWREGDVCHADWTGTADQAPGSINFHIHEGLCKLFFGIYMIMAFDPEILFNDGLDGHSWWPLFRTTPAEYAESYYPIVIERYVPVCDSGGAGLHRGGTGIEKVYRFTGDGEFTVHDDRALISPWGIGGGRAAGRSSKQLIRTDGSVVELPSKLDAYRVQAGECLVFRTAGGGGWGDPLERAPAEVLRDVRRELVSAAAAQDEYGVVIRDDAVDEAQSARLRATQRAERGEPPQFDFGEVPDTVSPQ